MKENEREEKLEQALVVAEVNEAPVLAEEPVHRTVRAGEIRQRRGRNSKVFHMSDGSEQAVFYPGAIHVLDPQDNAYVEPDNTLTEDEDGKYYRNKKGNFTARFSREEDSDELFHVEQGEYRVMVSACKAVKQRKSGLRPKRRENVGDTANHAETLVFEDADLGVDLEYSIMSGGVKENIVVKEKAEAYRYVFDIHCENLTVRFEKEDKRLAFISTKTGEEVFFCPAPFMADVNGEISMNVDFGVKALASGDTQLTVTADSTWINAQERVFPVIIDPQIMVSRSSYMTTYCWKNDVMSSAALHCVGVTGADNMNTVNRMYMNFSMPTLPRNPRIKKAELTFTQYNGVIQSGTAFNLGLYQVTGTIASGSATPAMDTNLLDYAKMKTGTTEDGEQISYTFDVTKLVDQINKGETSLSGLVLKMVTEDTDSVRNIALYGSNSAYAPKLSVTYETNYGVNTSYRTHTHALGRFGQGSVDLVCGNLMFEVEDFAWAGNRMPVTIRHLYNSALSNCQYTNNSTIKLNAADFSAMHIGLGWKLNLMQSMQAITFWHEDIQYTGYVYTNENGEEIYFKQGNERVCCNSNTQCYYLYEDVTGGEMKYDPQKHTLTQGEDVYLFDSNGRLIRITDVHENTMNIAYEEGKIVSVSDGVGRVFTFAYNTDGSLDTITAPDGTFVGYSYTDGLLTDMIYPDRRTAVISYANSKPSGVVLQDTSARIMYEVDYTFSGERVTSVTEYGRENGTRVVGNSTAYTYSAASRRTIVETTEQMDSDEGETENHVIKTVYAFDDDGNVISEYAYTEDTGNVGTDGSGSGIHPYAGDGGVNTIGNSVNLLLGHNFEDLTHWSYMDGNCCDAMISSYLDKDHAKYGYRLLRMESFTTDCVEHGVYQVTNVLPAGQYTFSAYLRVDKDFVGSSNSGAYIRVTDTSDNVLVESERITKADSAYIRLTAPFELTAAKSVKVQILMDGKAVVYADAAQLENNPFASPYNMLENGSFESGMTSWSGSGMATTAEAFHMNSSVMLTGDLNSCKNVSQAVTVRLASSIRETFTLSGWAKGYGLVNCERDGLSEPTFRLRAVVNYTDGASYEAASADFSPCTEEWQYVSCQFAKDAHKAVANVTVYCEYDNNFGTAYFDDIQLVRDSIETDWDATNLDEAPVDDSTEADNTAVEEQPTAPAFEEATDTYGNILTETTFTDGEFGTIYRSFQYGNNSNDLTIETDARGNETAYSVNTQTSRNEEITDRCGNKTAYEYDAEGRTTKVTSKDANGTEIANVSYTYDGFDNLSEIVRGDGMKYVLQYNAFHNLESIGVDGKDEKLVTYTYKTGNGRLKAVTYANGDTMKATYNSLGQMVAEKWYNSANTLTAHYKYAYDGQGNIVRSLDMTAGKDYNYAYKEYNYTYEEGRLVRSAEYIITAENDIVTAKTLVNAVHYVFDAEGTLNRKRILSASGDEQTIYYETSDDNTVVKFAAGGKTVTSHSKTDSFGRKVFDEVQLGTGFVSRQFSYHAGEVTETHADKGKLKSSATTQLVSQIILSDGTTLSYSYDAEERITSVVETSTVNGQQITNTTTYTYDALGQLVTETVNDVVVNTMTYDNYGNIATKNGKSYTYGDNVWKDKLTAFNGESITYDAQGNPTSYLGHTLTWEKGRQLKSFDSNTYTYNANGIRTSKTVDGIRHDYVLDGAKILRETWGGNTLIPLYDNEESVCGILYNSVPYYFLKNLQGDVIAIADQNGETVASYTYDAWGACTIKQDTTAIGIATINPFRYRGYYYDTEIGMYYLQSRYYDPTVGRFVNADEVGYNGVVDKTNLLCLYTYCENDPVNKNDCTGFATVFVAGYGLQIEISGSVGVVGAEFVWYIVSSIRKGRSWYIPYIYLYGGASLNAEFTSVIDKIATNPTFMFNPKKIKSFSGSISIFAIFGYTGKFTRPQDYAGLFTGVSATIWHAKAYSAFCGTCFSVGVGISTSKFGASSGGTWYYLTTTLCSMLKNVYNSVAQKGKTIKG